MDGGNAGIEGIIFPAMANDLLYDLSPALFPGNKYGWIYSILLFGYPVSL
jgi:hypothetical protein